MFYFISVQFSHSVVPDSLRPLESQHARPPCPSPTPGVHSNSCPSGWWCHPAISSSVVPFSSCPQSLPATESFAMSQLFAWGGQSTGASALVSFLPKKSQGWSPSEWTGWISLHWPHQNISLACLLFQAENNQGSKDSGRPFDLCPNCLKDWGPEEKGMTEEEKGMTEDEMVGWHHRLNGHEFE